MLYDSFVRREVIDELTAEKRSQIHAIMSNSAYLESKEGVELRREEIEVIEEHFAEMIAFVRDPEPEPEERLEDNPLFAAGMRGLDKLKWEYGLAQPGVDS